MGGRLRASPDAPASGRCVGVNQPQDQPSYANPTPPMFQPAPSAAFPCFSLVALGHPRPCTLSQAHTPSGPSLHLHFHLLLFYFAEGSPVPGTEGDHKASLAPFDSAVRVVCVQGQEVSHNPLIRHPLFTEHLCKRMTWALEPFCPIFTSLGILGKSLTLPSFICKIGTMTTILQSRGGRIKDNIF